MPCKSEKYLNHSTANVNTMESTQKVHLDYKCNNKLHDMVTEIGLHNSLVTLCTSKFQTSVTTYYTRYKYFSMKHS